MKHCAIIDLDDTILDLEAKLREHIPEFGNKSPEWRNSNKNTILDAISTHEIATHLTTKPFSVPLLYSLKEQDIHIKIITARKWITHARDITIQSLKDNNIPYDELIICDLYENKTNYINSSYNYVLSLEDNPHNHMQFMKYVNKSYCIKSPAFHYDDIPNVVECLSEIST